MDQEVRFPILLRLLFITYVQIGFIVIKIEANNYFLI